MNLGKDHVVGTLNRATNEDTTWSADNQYKAMVYNNKVGC